ncbi:MAG: von willebrand factor type a [Bacteroidetes bacterium HGW-Bacteroidetes-6]|jgi:Ca-activated chloride channel family protein|nr:MAG: von willebrand factor type a [Bacteroidetes bacterium HGW-Bacteroidetes-6]
MKRTILILFFSTITLGISAQVDKQPAENPVTTRILFLFDASQSMYGRWQSDMKITIARKIMSDLLDSLAVVPNLELALRCYGHTKDYPPQDCDDTRLEVPFGPNNIEKIKLKLKTINPRGTTPIAYSLEKTGGDFPPCDHCRNIVILITDGLEECDGDPCAVSLALQKKGIILKPFIIGIGKSFREQFECVGTYFDATTEKEFRTALNVVISQALNSTTCQVNLLDISGNATETNVNMTFYDKLSGLPKYNFIHTLNNKGFPDTLTVDPLLNYRIQVHTIPPVFIDSLVLTPGKHTIVGTDAPQGFLEVKAGSTSAASKNQLLFIVRQNGSMQTLNVQYTNQREKYIVGTYDLEIMTLPRTKVNGVKIDQSTTTTVEIPGPGTAVIQFPGTGYGSLYVKTDNTLEWVYNFKGTGNQEALILQPGDYVAVYRTKYQNRSMFTIEKSFSVKTGSISKVNISIF